MNSIGTNNHDLDSSSTQVPSVTVHVLRAGRFTLPERYFVYPADTFAGRTVPSFAFLIQHRDPKSQKTTRILFDLGLRRDVQRYAAPIRKHIETRKPLSTDPDVVQSLAKGGLTPADIDIVILSHVHWDHIGDPADFPNSIFIIGNGSLNLFKNTNPLPGSHSFFESDLLPLDRTLELPDPCSSRQNHIPASTHLPPNSKKLNISYSPYLRHPQQTVDLFSDNAIHIVPAPGHLPGHINLLIRTDSGSIYLAGDACHDRRILRGERQIGTWEDGEGKKCCIHTDPAATEETLQRIRALESEGVEVVFAHDQEWEEQQQGKGRFFGD